jgi:hypothetical protein
LGKGASGPRRGSPRGNKYRNQNFRRKILVRWSHDGWWCVSGEMLVLGIKKASSFGMRLFENF